MKIICRKQIAAFHILILNNILMQRVANVEQNFHAQTCAAFKMQARKHINPIIQQNYRLDTDMCFRSLYITLKHILIHRIRNCRKI